MKNKWFPKLLGIGLLMVAVVPRGYGLSRHLAVDIPFDFVVADKTLPPGQYVLWSESSNRNAIRIQGANGTNYAIVMTGATIGRKSDDFGHAVFTCYGDRCFLSQLWFAGGDAGRELFQCSSERHLVERHEAHYAAVLPPSRSPEPTAGPDRPAVWPGFILVGCGFLKGCPLAVAGPDAIPPGRSSDFVRAIARPLPRSSPCVRDSRRPDRGRSCRG
jgi:hypothetical protein